MRHARQVSLCAAALVLASAALAQTAKPSLPPGRDPGGVAVAVMTTGVDYTAPPVALRLARDGEGELIGYDLLDNDNRPFGRDREQTPASAGGDGTRLAADLADPTIGARLVPVRVDPRNPASLARAVAFISHTPARIVVVPMWSPRKEDWLAFGDAAEKSPQLLFVVAAGDGGQDIDKEPVYPAALGLPNILVVTAARAGAGPSDQPRLHETANWGATAVDAAAVAQDAALAACAAAKASALLLAHAPASGGAQLKERLLALSPLKRENEIPRRTRTLSIVDASALKLARDRRSPEERILDKSRIPERMPRMEPRDKR
jgi:hypothetical protein